MTRRFALFTIALALVGLAAAADIDSQQVNLLLDRWLAARNAHAAADMRSLFDADMDQIRTSDGTVVATSADAAVKWFDDEFRQSPDTNVAISRRSARLLSADAALVDFVFQIHSQSGAETAKRFGTLVCTKKNSAWRIAAIRFGATSAGQP